MGARGKEKRRGLSAPERGTAKRLEKNTPSRARWGVARFESSRENSQFSFDPTPLRQIYSYGAIQDPRRVFVKLDFGPGSASRGGTPGRAARLTTTPFALPIAAEVGLILAAL
jgi:hypothetical protein